MEEVLVGVLLLRGFVSDVKNLVEIMVGDLRIQLGFLVLGGWDIYVN